MEKSISKIKELLKLELSKPKVESGINAWRLLDGRVHRKFGPALEWANGDKEWYLNGERHRENGPAVEYVNGHKEYWINGYKLKNNK